MSWLIGWLAFALIGAVLLYIGYGFAMSAQRARDDKANPSPGYVVKVDVTLAVPIVILDGLYNAFVMPVFCLDLRPRMAFRLITFKGVTFPFFELVTERLSRYNENPNEWLIGRWWAVKLVPFLDQKDPKGWHIRKSTNE